MAKETVRYPDELVARIEAVVDRSSAFESKSEYHRFASEFLLTLLDPEHDPSVLGYGDILAELEGDLPDEAGAADGADDTVDFLEAYVRVRRHLLRGEAETAAAYVDDAYAVTDREALLLEEVVARHAGGATEGSPTRAGETEPQATEPTEADGDTADAAETAETAPTGTAGGEQEPAGISARAVSDGRETDTAEDSEQEPSERDRGRRPTELEVSDVRMD